MRELLEEHVPRVYRFAMRLTKDPHAAEDLTQETFLRAWRNRNQLRERKAIRIWLFRIAANLWRDQLRRNSSPAARADSLKEDPASGTTPADHQASQREDVHRALVAMDSLPPRQRTVLYPNACEGASIREIATILDIHADAVKSSLSLARKKMREQLRDVFEGLHFLKKTSN